MSIRPINPDQARKVTATVSQLSPARLKQVLERMSRSFYDRAEIRDEVLRRLSDDLEADSTQG